MLGERLRSRILYGRSHAEKLVAQYIEAAQTRAAASRSQLPP